MQHSNDLGTRKKKDEEENLKPPGGTQLKRKG